jgi:hypothetical protein
MLSRFLMVGKVWIVFWIACEIFCRLIGPEHAKWARTRALPMMMLFYAVGMLGINVWVLYITLIAYLPLVANSRADGAALFIVALGSVPNLDTGLFIGGAAIIDMDKYFCLAFGLAIVFIKEPRIGLRSGWHFDLPFMMIISLEFVQARGLNFTSGARTILTALLSIALPYYSFSRSINTAQDMRLVMVAFTFICFMLAIIGIFESFTHFFVFQQMYQALGVGGAGGLIYKSRGGLLRSVASFGDATAFSLYLAVGCMAAIACRYSFKSTSRLTIALMIMVMGIFVTSSRNAYVALVISILAFDFFRRRYLALIGKAAVLGGMFAVLLLGAELSPYVAAMMGKSQDTAATSDYRSTLLKRGQEEFWKHPYLGTNSGTVMINLRDLVQGEGIIDFVNGYLFYALTCGFGGIVAMLIAFLGPAWGMLASRRALKRHPYTLERYGAFVFAIGVTFAVTTAFTAFGGRNSSFYTMVTALGAVLYGWRRLSFEMVVESDPTGPGLKRRPPKVVEHELGPMIPVASRRPRAARPGFPSDAPLVHDGSQGGVT